MSTIAFLVACHIMLLVTFCYHYVFSLWRNKYDDNDVPNVTAHPSTASVPITVWHPLLCGFNMPIKGLSGARHVR